MHEPHNCHLADVKRIFRYMQHTKDHGLFISRSSNIQLQIFSAVDWAGCSIDRHFTTGIVVYLGTNLLSWSNLEQQIVSRSSTEAKYKALADGTTEVKWLVSLLAELGLKLPSCPNLWCYNMEPLFLPKIRCFIQELST